MILLRCPVCGAIPTVESNSLWNEGAIMDAELKAYNISCPKCGLISEGDMDHLVDTVRHGKRNAFIKWNKKVNEIREHMGKDPLPYQDNWVPFNYIPGEKVIEFNIGDRIKFSSDGMEYEITNIIAPEVRLRNDDGVTGSAYLNDIWGYKVCQK